MEREGERVGAREWGLVDLVDFGGDTVQGDEMRGDVLCCGEW